MRALLIVKELNAVGQCPEGDESHRGRVTGDPMRIDGGSVEFHSEKPVVGGVLKLLAQRASLMVDAIVTGPRSLIHAL